MSSMAKTSFHYKYDIFLVLKTLKSAIIWDVLLKFKFKLHYTCILLNIENKKNQQNIS